MNKYNLFNNNTQLIFYTMFHNVFLICLANFLYHFFKVIILLTRFDTYLSKLNYFFLICFISFKLIKLVGFLKQIFFHILMFKNFLFTIPIPVRLILSKDSLLKHPTFFSFYLFYKLHLA